jgi:hypothetical protein
LRTRLPQSNDCGFTPTRRPLPQGGEERVPCGKCTLPPIVACSLAHTRHDQRHDTTNDTTNDTTRRTTTGGTRFLFSLNPTEDCAHVGEWHSSFEACSYIKVLAQSFFRIVFSSPPLSRSHMFVQCGLGLKTSIGLKVPNVSPALLLLILKTRVILTHTCVSHSTGRVALRRRTTPSAQKVERTTPTPSWRRPSL